MKKLLLCVLCSNLIYLAGCKNPPPDITPCLIDVKANVAHCSPVNASKKPYDIPLSQMNKFYAYSNGDMGVLLNWIIQHTQ